MQQCVLSKVDKNISKYCKMVNTMAEVKVLDGYRVTILKEAREQLRIRKGDLLKFSVVGEKMILQPKKKPESLTLEMLGLAAGYDKSPEEAIIEEIKDKIRSGGPAEG